MSTSSGDLPVGVLMELAKAVNEDGNPIERAAAAVRTWAALYGQDPDPATSFDTIIEEVVVGLTLYLEAADGVATKKPQPDESSLLASLFAVVDAVFTEHDAFARPHVTMGRIYREWKKVRRAMGGEDYVSPEHTQPEVTVVFDGYGVLKGVYADARDAGYALKRLDESARAETVVLW